MAVRDIYYVLFRHKWKILICALSGFIAAAVLYLSSAPTFRSEAKLYVRYVVTESKPLTGGVDERKSPDRAGETIMESEVEILTSTDLANQVVEAIGAAKILAKSTGDKNPGAAVSMVRQGLLVEVPPRSTVIRITFSHPDPEIAQLVLRELIDRYLKRHYEIHRAAVGLGDLLSQETDQLRVRLAQTEDELRKARNKAGVISVDEAKRNYSALIAHLREEIINARAELAERTTTLTELSKRTPAEAGKPAASSPTVERPSSDDIDAYKKLIARLGQLQAQEAALLTQYTDENVRVKECRAQMDDVQKAKKELEQAHPGLLRLTNPLPTASSSAAIQTAPAVNMEAEAARVAALQARINELNATMDQVRADVTKLDQLDGDILELTRQKQLYETNYLNYSAKLQEARISEAFSSGKVPNISQVQAPSPPMVDRSKTSKIIGMVSGGGLALGIAWAFLIELYVDRSVRRPSDIERGLRIPLFLSIPRHETARKHKRDRRFRWLRRGQKKTSDAENNGTLTVVDPSTVDSLNGLRPFHETLRDRLIGYFESRNLTHKPKLVAVTGIGAGSGVSTIAAGLASTLSETGDGNVLLVDMTPGRDSAQRFYHGKAVCGIDELLATRNQAQVQDNLYVVADDGDGAKLSRALPQRFSKILPVLKTSEFDFIIFDMPPVSQISITPRLAKFMNMVLLVIESEKTDLDVVQRAAALLTESKAHVGAVLNKTKAYVPARLAQELSHS